MSRSGRWRNGLRAGVALAVLVTVAACTPPPPLAAPDAPPVPAAPTPTRELVVGVDDLSGGFNPHTVADLNPVTDAVAGLLLPSAFRQARDSSWQIDYTVLESARVTGSDPFTVTYRVRRDAAWSDGAPIAAEDFAYLAEEMGRRPGVVSGAGYRLIDEVVSADGGKTVRVVFRDAYPGWRTLFRELLPAHLLKDAPGGWTAALDDGIPVSGGPFVLSPVDPARRELVLARNDRYWDVPAWADRLVLRQLTDGGLADALASGNAAAVLSGRPDRVTLALLAEAGVRDPLVVPQPSVVQVVLRSGSPALGDPRVRAAVAAALDRRDLIALGTAGGPGAGLAADAQVLAPSEAGYAPTRPLDPVAAPDPVVLLTEAGYTRTADGWTRGGTLLELVVAAPEGSDPYSLLAARVVEQLAAVGIGASLRTPPADRLYGTIGTDAVPAPAGGEAEPPSPDGAVPASPPVDIAVVARPAGGDPATLLAATYGCSLPGPDAEPVADDIAAACESTLQPAIEGALSGRVPVAATIAGIEPVLWRRAVAIPLYQQASVFVAAPDLEGVSPGPLMEGPLDGASRWRRAGA